MPPADDINPVLSTERPPASAWPRRGIFLLIVLTLLWGINWPVMKIALTEVPVLTFRATCIYGAGVTILLLHWLLGQSIRVPRHQWRPMLVSGLFNITLWHFLTGYGLVHTTSGRAAIIGYTMPIWAVPIGYVVLKDRPGWRRLTALGLGMSGLAVLFFSDTQSLDAAPLGALLMLGGAIVWACGTIAHKQVAWEVPTWVLIGWQCIICGFPILISAIVVDQGNATFPSVWPLIALCYNVFVPFVICYYAYYEIVRIFPVGVSTIGMLGIPIIGLFSGALLLGEPLGWAEYVALTLVVSALALPVVTRPETLTGRP